MAVDGHETWNVQNYSYPGEADLAAVDRDWAIRMILGVGPEFPFEVLSTEDWVARRLVADRFQDRRVFICGDAAHLWIPLGGYGMNAGIADAANLAWKLAGVLNGWASPAILDAYNAERQPITDQVSRLIADVAGKVTLQRDAITADIERQDAVGEATRARVGKAAYALDVDQQCCGGLNFGYYYDRSPIIAYDGERQPAYTMGTFTSSSVPGCRAPHLWLEGRRSLYDALGPDYTLLRFDPADARHRHRRSRCKTERSLEGPGRASTGSAVNSTGTNSSWCARISMWHGVATRNRTRRRTLLISSAALVRGARPTLVVRSNLTGLVRKLIP